MSVHLASSSAALRRMRQLFSVLLITLGALYTAPSLAVPVTYFDSGDAAGAACWADVDAVDPTHFWQSCAEYVTGDVRRWAYHGQINGDDPVWDYSYPQTACPNGGHYVSPGVCQEPGQDAKNCSGCARNGSVGSQAGNPINTATGNKYQKEEDYRGSALTFVRYFNSVQVGTDVGFGYGWTTGAHKRIETIDATRVLVRQGDGRGEPFVNNAGNWQGDADTTLTLTQDASGYTLSMQDHTSERYNTSGQLVSETDRAGNTTSYSYDGSGRLATITGPFGHTMSFAYDGNGRVQTMTDANNKIYTYSYDANGNLSRVTYPDTTARIYHYENATYPHHLTGVSIDNGQGNVSRFSTFAYSSGPYDQGGKAVSTEHATTDNGAPQEKTTIGYSYEPGTATTITDAIGNQRSLTFNVNLGVRSVATQVNLADSKKLTQTFDAQNNVTCKQDDEGNVTTYTYNATNQKTSMTEGQRGDCSAPVSTSATRTTTYQYLSAQLSLPTRIESPSVSGGTNVKATVITYDPTTQQPATITQSGFTPSGTATSRTVTLTYNTHGQLATIDGPRTDVTDITALNYYDCTTGGRCGQLSSITNAIGQITTFDNYDANGRLLQKTDPNGLVTAYVYDDRGRVTRITVTPPAGNGSPRITQYTYDPVTGKTATATLPDNRVLTYTYDAAHYLRSITDNLGNKVTYGYDLKGNRTSEQTYDPDNTLVRTIQTSFDARDYVASINAAGSLTSQVHDALGNLSVETDPNNANSSNPARTTYQYDALSRLLTTINRAGDSANYSYDINDRVKQVVAPNGLTTAYVYDDLGNLLQENSPQRGTLNYTYDAAGNIATLTDARGISLAYSYDALNRVTSVDAPGTSDDVTYVYDTCTFGKGKLCRVIDASGTSRYTYDAFGNIAREEKDELGVTYVTQYTYDAADRVSTVTYPDGRIVAYTRDAIGRVTDVIQTQGTTNTTLVTGLTYRADGLVKSLTYGNSITESRGYNTKGELTSQSVGGIANASYGYDLNGNPTSIGSASFTFDALDRLITAGWGSGSNTYTYEGNGDLLMASLDLPAGPTNETFTYTNLGQLASVKHDNSTVASFTYNYQRQRTRKNGVIYHYDLYGNLLQETDSSGTPIRTYVWLDNQPIAQINTNAGADSITYLHADHLNTPRWGTDSAGAQVWSWGGEPNGQTAPTGTVTVDLRFAGQYFDGETGLFYNWNRYYDPKTGRYISSDPIGLDGGLNTYSYVRNNPLRHTDPSGLFDPTTWVQPVVETIIEGGTAVGAAIASGVVGVGSLLYPSPAGDPNGGDMIQPNSPSSGTSSEEKECKNCPPCKPPVGTIGYRLDTVPPSKPHKPFPGDHIHLFKMNQNPNNCQCFWQPIGVTEPPPPPGAVPLN